MIQYTVICYYDNQEKAPKNPTYKYNAQSAIMTGVVSVPRLVEMWLSVSAKRKEASMAVSAKGSTGEHPSATSGKSECHRSIGGAGWHHSGIGGAVEQNSATGDAVQVSPQSHKELLQC